MKRLILLLILATSVALAGKNPRAEKNAERAERLRATPGGMILERPAVSYWDTMAIYTADMSCLQVIPLAGGVMWMNAYTVSTGDDLAMRSTDNGATWATHVLTFTNTNGYHLGVVNENVAVAAVQNGAMFRTTDAGATWDSVYYYGGGSGYFDGIKHVGGDTLIAFGDAFDATGLHVIMSVDAGATWTRFNNLPSAELDAGTYGSSGYRQGMDLIGHEVWIPVYWGSGVVPQMLRTTDLGATWTTNDINLTGGASNAYYLRSINMVDHNVGWGVPRQTASGTRCYVHKTSDGGTTWSDTILVDVKGNVVMSVKPVPGTNNLLAIGYLGNDARAWWSTDGGGTWAGIQPPVLGDGGDLFNGAFVSTTMGYIVGDLRALIFTAPPTSVQPVTDRVPTSYALRQNYPNPFNPSTMIEYSIPKEGMVTLKVYNVLGQEVANLVQTHQSPGTYRVSFDARTLPSGTYLYTITAGGFNEVRKMLLIK